MKLKTFEDILDEINKLDCGYTTTDCVRDDVRQEAINQIKTIKTVKPIPHFDIPMGKKLKSLLPKKVNVLSFDDEEIELSDKELIKCTKVLNAWIKYFFNITEEDLQ